MLLQSAINCNNWISGGNTEYFEVPDKTVNKLKTKKELDRENPPSVLYVIIFTSNDCTNKPPIQPCSDINTTLPQYLNVSISVRQQHKTFQIIDSYSFKVILVGVDQGCK